MRRGQNEASIHFEHTSPCRIPDDHRQCEGRWRGVLSLGFGRPARSDLVAAWLAQGFVGRSDKTVTMNRYILQPVLDVIGRRPLR